jgi:hypothetical protein
MPIEDGKRTFEVDGTEYAVRIPKVQDIKEANELRSKTFNEALGRGDMLRDQLESELRKRELWNDNREMEYQTLRREVLDGEFKLKKGGIKLKDAKGIALDMSDNRTRMIDLLSSRTDLDSNTCEGKADAARFNFLFSSCLVYDETGDLYFPNKLDDYLLKQDDPVAVRGATEFYYLISGSEAIDDRLPENAFLKRFNFVDDQYRLVDDDGRLTDREGRHVDEYGNYIEWQKDGSYSLVDVKGRQVDSGGDFDVEHSPFLDDDDNPIDESIYEEVAEASEEELEEELVAASEEEKPKAKRKTRRKKKAVAEEPEPEPETVAVATEENKPEEEQVETD